MKIFAAGDRGVALAPDGRGWIPVTYRYRTVHLEQSGVEVPNVLVGVDPVTEAILTIPSQSTPRLKAARERTKDDVFQVKIPQELDDVLAVLADKFGASPAKFTPAVLRYYLPEAAENPRLAHRLVRLSHSRLATRPTCTKLSFRTSASLTVHMKQTTASVGGATKSVLARGAIVAAKEDLLDGRNATRTHDFESVVKAL